MLLLLRSFRQRMPVSSSCVSVSSSSRRSTDPAASPSSCCSCRSCSTPAILPASRRLLSLPSLFLPLPQSAGLSRTTLNTMAATPTDAPGDQSQHYDVVIVGGGMAGVSTAYHLIKQQSASSLPAGRSPICLLEARNRLGGRIHAAELPSCTVEFGANWIHGIVGNPIADIALKYKLADPLGNEATHQDHGVNGKRYTVQTVREDGKKVDLNLVEQVYDAYFWFTKQIDSYFAIAEREGRDPPAEFKNSAGAHLIKDIEQYLSSREPNDWIQVRRAIFKNLLHREAIISGSHTIMDVSLRDFGAYDDFPGGNLIVDAGFISIVNALLDEIDAMAQANAAAAAGPNGQSPLHLQLEKEVVKIEWRGLLSQQESGQSVSSASNQSDSQSKNNVCHITCQDGSKFTCNHVVITLPLGVLKETADLMFEPPLPEYKVQAIHALGFSVVDKIFLEFKNKLSPKFLDPTVNELLLVWAEDEEDEKSESNNNNISEEQKSGDQSETHNKSSAIVLKKDSPKHWFRTIYSLTKVSEYALLAWVSGQEAELVESMDPKVMAKVLTEEILRKFFHPEFPEPESVITTKWKSEKFTRGAYTFISTTSSVRDIERLSQPIYSDPGQEKPILLFAGEACHPTYFSTTHGAFLTGKKAASYLIDPESGSPPVLFPPKVQ